MIHLVLLRYVICIMSRLLASAGLHDHVSAKDNGNASLDIYGIFPVENAFQKKKYLRIL